MYKLKYTKEFERDLKKLTAAEQKQTANKLKLLISRAAVTDISKTA